MAASDATGILVRGSGVRLQDVAIAVHERHPEAVGEGLDQKSGLVGQIDYPDQ